MYSAVTVAIDPGESIGIVIEDGDNPVKGLTIAGEDRLDKLWSLLHKCQPTEIVFEEFALRKSAATKLVGNKFITCEVIGVIKLYAQRAPLRDVKLKPLLPCSKEYCGFSSNPKDPQYSRIVMTEKITEHVRDAYRLLRYSQLFGGQSDSNK